MESLGVAVTLWDQLWALVHTTEQERRQTELPKLSRDLWVRGQQADAEIKNLKEFVRLLTLQVEAQQQKINRPEIAEESNPTP